MAKKTYTADELDRLSIVQPNPLVNGGELRGSAKKDPSVDEIRLGDGGYFWDDPCISAVFGKLDLVLESYPLKYQVTLNGDFVRNFPNFSKTPPELK